MARITNDPRNQDSAGQNIGQKAKDAAQSAWDKDTPGWKAGENRPGQSTSSTTVDRREEGQDEGFSMNQSDKQQSSGSQGISGGKYGSANLDKSTSGAGLTYQKSQEGGGGAGGAGIGSQYQQPQYKNKLSSENFTQDAGGQTKGSYSSPGSFNKFNIEEKTSDSDLNYRGNLSQGPKHEANLKGPFKQSNENFDQSQNSDRSGNQDSSKFNQSQGSGQNQQRFSQSQEMNKDNSDRYNLDKLGDQSKLNQDKNMGQSVLEKAQDLAEKAKETLQKGYENVSDKVKQARKDQDKNKNQ
eukprot:403341698